VGPPPGLRSSYAGQLMRERRLSPHKRIVVWERKGVIFGLGWVVFGHEGWGWVNCVLGTKTAMWLMGEDLANILDVNSAIYT